MNQSLPSKSGSRKLIWLGGIVITLLVLNFCYQIWTKFYHTSPADANVQKCDLQLRACAIKTQDGKILQLELTPRPITAGANYQIAASINGFTAQHVFIVAFPLNQPTGHPPQELRAVSAQEYQGSLTLPSDATGSWIVMLTAQTSDSTNIAVPFRLHLG